MTIEPLIRPPDATVSVPGSKSITNRALVAAALAGGCSRLEGALFSDDTAAMVESLRRLGFGVREDEAGAVIEVEGRGGLVPATTAELDARQSGTTARFIAPLLALGAGPYRLDGSVQLRSRPMAPLVDAMRQLGAVVEPAAATSLPITIVGGATHGGPVRVSGDVSSQFLSGLLLSGPAMPDGLGIELTSPLVSEPYLDLTVAVMLAFGVSVAVDPGRSYAVAPAAYRATSYAVEPDASAASYFFAAAAITGGRVRVDGLTAQSAQGDVAFVDMLERMGAVVVRDATGIEVHGRGALHGVDVDMRAISDTATTIAAVAPFASSPTRVTGIGFIRRKESDRIAAVVRELERCGIRATEEEDGFVVHPGTPHGARIETYDDHRIAMSFALIGLRVPGIELVDPGCVAKTFPGYFGALDALR